MSDSKLSGAFCSMVEVMGEALVAVLGPKLIAHVEAHFKLAEDPLFTCKQAAEYLRDGGGKGISESKLRELVDGGFIHRAPGMGDIRIRKSVLDAYGKAPAK